MGFFMQTIALLANRGSLAYDALHAELKPTGKHTMSRTSGKFKCHLSFSVLGHIQGSIASCVGMKDSCSQLSRSFMSVVYSAYVGWKSCGTKDTCVRRTFSETRCPWMLKKKRPFIGSTKGNPEESFLQGYFEEDRTIEVTETVTE